jgi:hypothetical protein
MSDDSQRQAGDLTETKRDLIALLIREIDRWEASDELLGEFASRLADQILGDEGLTLGGDANGGGQ